MIASGVLAEPSFQGWCTELGEDPQTEQEDLSLPIFEELMGRKENKDVYGRAKNHLFVPPERDGEVLRQLWTLRADGSDKEYEQALRSEDLAGYLLSVDWASLGLYDQ